MEFASATSPASWFWDPECCRKTLAWARRHWGVTLHLFLAILVAGVALSFWSIRVSPPAQLALAQAQSSPAAQSMLGEPIRQSLIVTGMVEHLRSGQYADVRMKLYGKKGQGTLYANAVKRNGVWQLTNLDLAVDSRPGRLNLLPLQSTTPR